MDFLKQFLGATETNSQIFLGVSLLMVIFLITFRIVSAKSKNLKLQNWSWNITLYSAIAFSLIMGLSFASLTNFQGLSSDIEGNIIYDWKYEVYNLTQIYSNIFLSSIFFVIAPLIFFLMASSVIKTKGSGLLKSILFYVLGVTFAAIIAIAFAQLFRIVPQYEAGIGKLNDPKSYTSFLYTIVSFIPKNILASKDYSYSIIGILIGALVIGLAIALISKKEKNSKEMNLAITFLEAGKKIFSKITEFVLELLPIGVFGLLTKALFYNSIASFVNVSWFFLFLMSSIFLVMSIQILIVWKVNKINPITYLKKAWKPLFVAFTTQSSNGTLPFTEKALKENFNVNEDIASATPALGTTIGMVACGSLYPGLASAFVAFFGGLDGSTLGFDSLTFWILLLFAIVFSSFGLAGAPGVASVSTITVMDAVGINYSTGLGSNAFGTLLGFDPIIDMVRTMANVNGAIFVSLMVQKSYEKQKRKLAQKNNLEIKN